MELNEVKNFLKVDFNEDDEYIKLLIDVAIEYITDSIGAFKKERAKQRYLLLTLVSDMYEKRSFIVDSNDEKLRYVVKSIINQEWLGS